jgi:3-oxoacyl-(acyl-carrier-protein) synthase/thioesterase domain-containing protein/acyl carrier protein
MHSTIDGHEGEGRVAIIGIAGRFPGAWNIAAFWQNLANGVESLKHFSDADLLEAGEPPEVYKNPSYVKARPVLEGADMYDADFFGHSPSIAAVMDPQHRIFLETAWEALESAGYVGDARPDAVGVFATCGPSTYMRDHLLSNREVMDSMGEWLVRHTANDPNFLATRVSYELNLKGPSMNVQTACSSALVAVHLAAQSLLSRECDLAIAGASTIALPQDRGYLYREGSVLSPDGRCRPFDARARGTALGGGAGCVVLKRLDDALRDRDEVLAVLLGSAINNDGAAKLGYLAPSVAGQARVVAEALAVAGVGPETIGYVETHGTGTLVGDAMEIAALAQAYGDGTRERGYCAIGSVKPNIGHLGEAAGIASLLKAVLALGHRALPPSLNYESPNPEIDFFRTPFFVNTTLRDWRAERGPRRAGVTALGVGGTNAHVVLEEAPMRTHGAPPRTTLLVLSAKTDAALEKACKNLARHLDEHPHDDLADVGFTLRVGRRAFDRRRAILCADRHEARRLLEEPWRKALERGTEVSQDPDPATIAATERWLRGAHVDWLALESGESRRRVPLPTYSFERRRHWIARGSRPTTYATHEEHVRPPPPIAPRVLPRNDVEREIAAIFSKALDVEEIGVEDDFFDLGGDSLAAVRLFDGIRRRFGVDLPPSTLFAAPSVARCAELVSRESGEGMPTPRLPRETTWPSLVAIQPRGARVPFFCVAGMGGTLTNLRRLALLVGDDQPFYGFQPPGLDGREKRLDFIEDLAARYIDDLSALHGSGPVLLGGYSGGGIAAFEMARQLTRSGREVTFLGLIDSFSPALPSRTYADRFRIHKDRLMDVGPAYALDLVRRRLRYQSSLAARRLRRALSEVFPQRYRYDAVVDAWLEAERAYTPGVFDGSATLFRASEASALSLWSAFEIDEVHGWGRFVRRGVTVVPCPGNHTTICEEPHVRVLATKLREALGGAKGLEASAAPRSAWEA